jgi:LemA protein
MDKNQKKWLIWGIVVFIILWIFGSIKGTYNTLVVLENNIEGQWAQVENQLQRRNDLIPSLVKVVKAYATQEKDVFANIADARARLAGASSVGEKVKANNQLSGALSRLLMVVENYPQLQSNKNFLGLQDQLEGTENRIAVERQRFNDAVKAYNIKRKTFPTVIIASFMGFDLKKDYIEVPQEKQAVPEINL